jgi:hypothetical protein
MKKRQHGRSIGAAVAAIPASTAINAEGCR